MKSQYIIIFLLTITISNFTFSQIHEEKVRAKRTEQPDVKKIVKKNITANEPEATSIKTDSLQYQFIDIEPVSDFKTSQLAPNEIDNIPQEKLYENFAKAGYGNYDNLLLKGFFSKAIDEKYRVGAKAMHFSTTGLKKDFDWNSDSSKNEFEVFLHSNTKNGTLLSNINYNFNQYNLYGISDVSLINTTLENDLQMKYNSIQIKGMFDVFVNNYFDNASLVAGYFWDNFNSKETYIEANIGLDKPKLDVELPVFSDADFGFEANATLAYNKTDFSEIATLTNTGITAEIHPSVKFTTEKTALKLGASLLYATNDTSDINDFYILPNVSIEHQLQPEFAVFGGVDGKFIGNDYRDLAQKNPYLLPMQETTPTVTTLNFFAGIKGDLGNNFKYNAQAGYGKNDYLQFFKKSDYFNNDNKAYNYLNTFEAVYDNGSVMNFTGNLAYTAVENLSLALQLEYNSYNLDSLKLAYNAPKIKANIGANYLTLKKKLLLGAMLYFTGSRETNDFTIDYSGFIPTPIEKTETLPSFFDVNITASYNINSRFSIFINGLNLLNSNNQQYIHYSTQGTQVLGGIMYKF